MSVMSATDRRVDVPRDGVQRDGFTLHVGAGAAVFVFDLGDGRLQPADVVRAVQAARDVREAFP